MQMHESKANTTRSGSSSAQNQHHHHHKLNKSNNNNNSNHNNNNNNNKLPKNQSSDNNQPTPSKKSRSNRNSNRDRQPDNDAKPASVSMSNSSSYSFIEDDHIDDQESINVGNLIIDLESDLEKEKIESEQANNSVIDSNTKSVGSIANAPSSTSSATSLSPASSSLFATSSSSGANNNNKATSSTTIAESSNNNKIGDNKSNQKTTNKHSAINSNTNANTTNNNGHSTTTTSTRTVFKSSADERGELKMKITRETKPAKNEFNSKPVTSPSQKSPTCSSSNNNNNNNNHHTSHLNNLEDSCPIGDSTSSRPTQSSSSSISSTKECGTSTSVGTITEPECLGPCEPGTSVTLEGIVWQETEGGILVVNVTWRGKTYVGALLDCTRHDWAPPRLCDSPASDIDSKNSKGVRAKRIVTRSNGIGLDEKNLLQTTGKLRNGKGRRIPPTNDPASCSGSKKQPRDSSTEKASTNENQTAQSEGTAAPVTGGAPGPNTNTDTNSENPYILMNIETTQSNDQQNKPADQTTTTTTGNIVTDKAGPNSPMLIGCSEPNCSKKYRNMNGLLYHQTHAHGDNNDTNSAQDDNCSSSTKDKSSKVSPDEMQKESATTHEEADVDNNEVRTPSPSSSPADKDGFTEKQSNGQKRQRTPSPPCSVKMSKTFVNDQQQQQQQPQMPPGFYEDPYSTKQESSSSSTTPSLSRTSVVKNPDSERRHSSSSNFKPLPNAPDMMARRSPGASQRQPDFPSHGGSSSSSSLSSSNLSLNQQQQPHHHHHHHHSSTSKQSSSGSKQSNNPPPLPATTEEGMKPSGTSTGPPPAPHQANCYFNSAFLANSFNPYGLPPYFPRHMPFDPMAPPTPTSNAAFLSRFMNNMRAPPPPDSPSRLLSPASMPKNLPFPAFKLEPGLIPPPPVPTSLANAQLPNMSPLPPPPPPPSLMGAGSPHLRMPSQGDPMMPPTSQPPYLPPVGGINPALGLPGMPNPLVGPLGGPPQLPSLVDDSLAKQFPPRRFN